MSILRGLTQIGVINSYLTCMVLVSLFEKLCVIKTVSQTFDTQNQCSFFSVSKLTKELVQIKSEKSDTEMEIQEVRKKYKDLKHKYDEIMLDQSDKPAAESYLNTISELKM